ncbi:MAG: stage III sporulation protein AC [Clostridia bacterium]|nr:stage III sporulation protein AC [Clostridia bacterium]
MGVDLIIKIAGIGLLTAVISQVLKHSGKDDMATFATLSGVVVVLMMVLDIVYELFNTVKTMFGL